MLQDSFMLKQQPSLSANYILISATQSYYRTFYFSQCQSTQEMNCLTNNEVLNTNFSIYM